MEDLRDTINSGDYGGDASNILGSFFNASINPWARYKPVIYATTAKLTDAQLKSVNYGLSMPSATAFAQNLSTIQAVCNKSWVYNCPAGGASQPLRVSDFCGYYPNAEAPIQVVGSSWEVNKAISKKLRISVDADPGDSTYQLQAYDFSGDALDLPHCTLYGCIASGSSVVAWLQATGTLVDSSGNIGVTWIDHDCSSLNGRYTVYLCLKYANSSNTYLYPLPKGSGGGIHSMLPQMRRQRVSAYPTTLRTWLSHPLSVGRTTRRSMPRMAAAAHRRCTTAREKCCLGSSSQVRRPRRSLSIGRTSPCRHTTTENHCQRPQRRCSRPLPHLMAAV